MGAFESMSGECGKPLRWWGILVAAVLATGCVNTGFTPSTTLALHRRPQGCYVDLIFQGVPPFPYVVIGKITTDSTAPGIFAIGEGNEVAMQRMREQACEVGAHGLLRADTQSHGVWTNDGYSKSTTGEAIAFVYVDAAGNPLPPPTGPKLMIHPGGFPVPPPPPVANTPPAPGNTTPPWAAPPPGAPADPPAAVR